MDPDLTFVCLFAAGGMGLVIAVGMALQPRDFGRGKSPLPDRRARHRHVEVETLLGILDGIDDDLKLYRSLAPSHEGQRLDLREEGRMAAQGQAG